jgi:hypothetical protein
MQPSKGAEAEHAALDDDEADAYLAGFNEAACCDLSY